MKLISLLFSLVTSVVSFAQVPTITSFSPTQAEVGATVTITGTNFSTTANDNIVYFGGAKAIVSNATTTQLTVLVPNGSTRDFISVTKGGFTGYSRSNFNLFNSGTAFVAGAYSLGSSVTVPAIATTNSGLQNSYPGFDVIVGAADFDNNGWPDVFKAGNGAVSVNRNLLTGTSATIAANQFSAPSNFTVTGDVRSIVTADIDSDGKLDIITGSSTGISILRNTSTTGTISFATAVNISTATTNIRVADFDLDGKLDIAAVNNGNLNIFKNTTTSSITFNGAVATVLSTTGFTGIDIGDLNNDGKMDVVVTKNGTSTNVIVNNSTINTLTLSNSFSINNGTYYPVVDDIDKDGIVDIYTWNRWFKNNYTTGTLSISNFTEFTNSLVDEGGLGISAPDINADGYPEIILGSWWSHYWIYRNAGTGVSASIFSTRQMNGGGGHAIGVDLNGDQKVDVISSEMGSNFRINLNTMSPTSVITVNQSITTFNKCVNSASTQQSFTVSGAGLQGNIVITPPAGFEISTTNGSGFGTTAIALTPTSGTVNSTTIYVRVTAANNTASSVTLSLTSTGASTISISLASTISSNNIVGTASSTPTICANTALTNITHATTGVTGIGTATGLPAGVTASFASNTITISGTPSASGTFSYTIPTTGGCGSVNATGTITVNANNTVGTASSTPTICVNTALTNITHATTGVTGIGTATGLPAGVTASFASNTITISGTPSASGTFSYTIPTTGGCGSVNATGTITVNANNTVGTASSTPTICANTALTNITHATTGVTGIGTATGLPAGVTASFASNTITISGTPTASGTFSYTIPTTGGCGTVNATGTITVSANNTLGTLSANPTLCVNTVLTNITRSTTGATGIGTATNLPAGVTASWSANVIAISGTPTASGTFSYTIPTTGGCGTVNATGTITVLGTASASSASSSPSVCNGSSMTSITHTTTGASSIGIPSGLPGGVNVAFSNNTITISGSPSKTYTVGNFYNGGVIAYIFQPVDNGYTPGKVLIVDPQYKIGPSCTDKWTMSTNSAATSELIGEGFNNTFNLNGVGSGQGQAIGFAFAYTDGTYDDWFVPSQNELIAILTNLPTSIFPNNGSFIRSSTEVVGSLAQTHAYFRSGGSLTPSNQNDLGCANTVIARYDVLPTFSNNPTFNYTIPLSSCPTTNVTGVINITDTYTWTGATTNPATASNWNPAAVPCSGANVVIPSGAPNYPSYTNLTINAGATLTVQSGAQLTVTGTLTNNGTMVINSGATFVQGTSLAGTGSYQVRQVVTGSNDGTNPTGRFWYMGVPINNLTRSTAFGTAGTQNRLWSWSESGQAWSSQLGDAMALTPTTGYSFRTGAASTELNFIGTSLYSANPSISGLTNTSGSFSGCHLMSNPFTAYADWEQIYTASTNISSTYCVRSFNTGNSQMVYDTYNATGDVAVQNGSYAVTRYIAPMQSFWIIVNPSTTGTFNMTKSMLSHQPSATGLKDLSTFNAFARLNLIGGNLSDQVVVYMTPDATNALDAYDSKKMMLSNVPQVYTTLGNDKLVINGLKESKAHTIVPLTLQLPTSQTYHFEMAESNVNYGLVILEDREELVFQDMTANPDYSFFAQGGISSDRFVLHFHFPLNTASTEEIGSSSQIDIVSNNTGAVNVQLSDDLQVGGEITVLDQSGRLVAKKTITQAQTLVQINETAGVYFVRVQTPGKTEMKKVVLY